MSATGQEQRGKVLFKFVLLGGDCVTEQEKKDTDTVNMTNTSGTHHHMIYAIHEGFDFAT